MTEALLVLTTTSSHREAERLAEAVVSARLAACAQVLPSIKSFYTWNGKVETATESLILLKTTLAAYPELEALVKAEHSYDTPEIIAIPVAAGSSEYLSWIQSVVGKEAPSDLDQEASGDFPAPT